MRIVPLKTEFLQWTRVPSTNGITHFLESVKLLLTLRAFRWISGYDGGEKGLLGFSTACAEYVLLEPSPEYEPFMKIVRQKMLLSKIVIEFVANEFWENPTYEDLLERLQSSGQPDMSEELLIRHAQFVCDQVMSLDAQDEDEERPLITAPCMRALVKMAGVNFQKRYKMRRTEKVL